MRPQRGEIWLVDLGLAAKVRPALVVSVDYLDAERALVAIVPHTTALRNTRFEVALNVRGLQTGAFDAQGLRPIPPSVFLRRIAVLPPAQMEVIETALLMWLGMARR